MFYRVMKTINGSISRNKLLLNETTVVYNTVSSSFYGKKIDINESHKILGYWGSDKLEKTAKIPNLK
jgi:hypothetical protein